MRLDGWNYIPQGYGLSVDASAAPLWLRAWYHLPLFDRFAYPMLVHRGCFYLTPFPDWPEEAREAVPPGWRVVDE